MKPFHCLSVQWRHATVQLKKAKELKMKRIGWIGTGIMGKSMCGHLLKAGYEVAVHTRTKSKAEELLQAGAVWKDTPKAVAEVSDCVFSIVGYPEDVESVLLGAEGALAGLASGGILVDMTTSKPSLAVAISEAAAQKGVKTLDAPVSGGDSGAKEGKLAIMVGGDQSSAGLDMEEVISVVGKGAGANWAVNNLGPKIAQGNYDPGFFIKHFVKDLGIAMEEARRMKLALPGLATAQQFYHAAMAEGLEDLGTQGLYKVYQRLNGRDA
ncbi:MAG: NAD(P)-dependent oxidoreductase [Spirochaeta sp.]|nr:NAD(P)-dependent oxidoreductase [Spirochaeta sp.]